MGAKRLEVGERGTADVTPQKRDDAGKWKRAASGRSADRWRARCYYRDAGGVMRELSRFGATRAAAESALDRAFEETKAGLVELTERTKLVDAWRVWLEQIGRTDSRLSERTVVDYGRTFARYVDTEGSTLRGLTLAEANNAQRLRSYLQRLADEHGTASAKVTRSVLMGILGFAVDSGALSTNALRNVRAVEAQRNRQAKRQSGEARDTRRAFTRTERDAVVAYARDLADAETGSPQTRRKRRALADLIAFLAGTGVRITEARHLRWEHVDLSKKRADILGTKSARSNRRLTLPDSLVERMQDRAELTGATGYVFASPHHLETGEVEWDQSNCAKAVAATLAEAGYGWATPHTFRRTVATLAHTSGAPLIAIADQLGHANPTMTANVYLGRDPWGDRSSVAQYL